MSGHRWVMAGCLRASIQQTTFDCTRLRHPVATLLAKLLLYAAQHHTSIQSHAQPKATS